MKLCKKCGVEKRDIEPNPEFAKSKRQGTHSWCKPCAKERHKVYYQENKQHFTDYKTNIRQTNQGKLLEFMAKHGCKDCGLHDPLVLEFDHIDPNLKTENISTMLYNGRKWESLLEEIAKCEIRCCNCHRRRTIQQFGWFRGTYAGIPENV